MKRIYSILLALCVSSMLFAQLSIWNGSSDIWTKGAGTETSPYLIESAEQLAFISDMVNGGVTTYENTYFKLMTNIDLNNQTWVPIGAFEDWAFKGNFDGNNYCIYGAKESLFGNIVNSLISHINIEMQGLAKYAESATISYIYSNALFSIKDKDCYIDRDFGCIVTECLDTDITFCIGKTNASAIGLFFFGGIVGKATNSNISNCRTYSNNIRCRVTTSSVEEDDEYYRGGIVGYLLGGKIQSCSSHCSLNGFGSKYYPVTGTGDIIGGGYGDISYCESLGYAYYSFFALPTPSFYDDGWRDFYSGIMGVPLLNSNSFIKNSFTILSDIYGKPIYDDKPKYGEVTLNNSYCISDKTEASMKSASFPIVLNTDSTVFIQDKFGVNDGYPIYKEQVYAITNPATDIQLTSANLSASYYALSADSIGFEYKESADKTHWYKRVTIDTLSSDSSYTLDNLATGTEYTYRFWVAQNGVFYFGEALTFTTQECSTNTYPETATICNGEEYEFANKILTKSGVYYDTLTAVNGCDSIIELTLTVSPVNEIQKYDTIQAGDSYDFFGNILTETGIYKHYIPAGAYCNLVIMNLYVKQPSVVVSVQSSNPSLGTVIGGGTYEKYTPITLTAIPNQGCRFVKWTDGNTDNPRIIIPESDCTYIAEFEEVNYTLTLAANDVAMGNVFGAGTYKYGTEVAINAIPNTGYQFTQWSDNDTNASRTITITSDLSLTAYFQPIKYTIIATANDETLGTVYGSGEYAYNTSVSLMAVPQNGCEFITWSNGANSNPYTFVAVDNVTLQAIFRATSSGVEDVDVNANTPTQKILRDGQLLIIRDGKTYNVMGQEL